MKRYDQMGINYSKSGYDIAAKPDDSVKK